MATEARRGSSPRGHHAAAAAWSGSELYSTIPLPGRPESVGSLLARQATSRAGQPAYGVRQGAEFRTVSWGALGDDVTALGRFLVAAGVGPGDRVVAFSPNRAELLVVELATMSLGAVYVPIFAGYAEAQAKELVAQARPAALFVPGPEQLQRTGIPGSVRVVVTCDPMEPAERQSLVGDSVPETTRFADALMRFTGSVDAAAARRDFLAAAAAVDPGAPALMMFTSGTTGRQKGVVLSHDNILSQQRALSAIWSITPADRFLCYLPWHHSFGGIFEKYAALYNGATLFLDDSAGKDFDRLLHNWKAVRPTIYFSIPKIYQQLVVRAQGHPEETWILHPELRFVFTAAAALPANLATFFADRGIPVLEGWGLTETAPCCTVTDLAEPRTVPGMVGYPIPGVRLRIASDGEILVQGPNVMRGYFEDPEATARALPGDGWFRTGDLGVAVGAGLKLVARKDRVFKLLNAEKVVPTGIENQLAGMNPYIRHVIVVGSGRDYLAALVFPDFYRIGEEFGADTATADQVVKASLRETVRTFNREHPIRYEKIRAFAVISRELTIEGNELTPSLKVRIGDVLNSGAGYVEAVYDPSADCDCHFLRKVFRLEPDSRSCFAGRDRTLDQCHECGNFVFGDPPDQSGPVTVKGGRA
jgi:long-subunit acyl-CoA synthetase (AMP-forming)